MLIGIGNTLRRDDGAGVAVIERLRGSLESCGVVMATTHQLLPELAEEISPMRHIVFIDARTDITAGRVTVERMTASAKPQAAGHYVTPAQLMAMARLMYGCEHEQTAYVIGIGAADLDHGEGLTDVVHHAVSRVTSMLYRATLEWTCGGDFNLPNDDDQPAAVADSSHCELKWRRYIEREIGDA